KFDLSPEFSGRESTAAPAQTRFGNRRKPGWEQRRAPASHCPRSTVARRIHETHVQHTGAVFLRSVKQLPQRADPIICNIPTAIRLGGSCLRASLQKLFYLPALWAAWRRDQ